MLGEYQLIFYDNKTNYHVVGSETVDEEPTDEEVIAKCNDYGAEFCECYHDWRDNDEFEDLLFQFYMNEDEAK